jgi:sporulation protein YlmC with PRC-barrel domain
MTSSGAVDLALGILDHQLLDAEGRRCGKIDDLELEGIRDGRPVVAAIVSGPAGWRGRGRLGRLATRLASGATAHIPWTEVAEVRSAVVLRRKAGDYGLGQGDDRARPWVERLPGSSL